LRFWRGVVFDLDDTLYPERDYVASGFRAVAAEVAARTSLSAGDVYDGLWGDFQEGRRGDLFDRLLARRRQARNTITVAEMVEVYRGHRPAIELTAEVEDLLSELKEQGIPLGLISDGYRIAQQAKVESLKLETFFDPLILTDALGREFWKPHERAFRQVEEAWDLPGAALVYIGDNPTKDFIAPQRRGWTGLRLRRRGQESFDREAVGGEAADEEHPSFRSLAARVRAGVEE